MSNFICLNGSLRFDPNSVTFCNDLLHYDCLSKAYLGAGVLALTQDILSHALPACRLGEGAMPHCDRSGLRRKNRHHQPGSTSTMPISRAPSSPVDERCAGWQDQHRWRAKPPDDGFPPSVSTPLVFFTACFGTEPKIGSHGASGRLRSHTEKYFAWGWWRTMAEVDCSGSSWSSSERVRPICSALSNASSCFWSARLGQAG